jgi:hypothetical protein
MASPPGVKHTPAAVLLAATGGLYATWLACWLLGTSGAVPYQAMGVAVWIMAIVMFGAPIVLSAISIWLAVVMLRNPMARTLRNTAALAAGVLGILGFALMSVFAIAGARLA